MPEQTEVTLILTSGEVPNLGLLWPYVESLVKNRPTFDMIVQSADGTLLFSGKGTLHQLNTLQSKRVQAVILGVKV